MNKPTLRKGSTGPAVKDLQSQLKGAGVECGKVDGVFGAKTFAAVMLFQTRTGLLPDGIVGAKSWTALEKSSAPMPSNLSTEAKLAAMFATAKLIKGSAEVELIAARIIANRPRYAPLTHKTGVPWWVIGILHSMECSLSFQKHLHNGDSLKARTVQVPKGRPTTGDPPFAWDESAIDALRYDKFDRLPAWDFGTALDAFEKYNGLGYRKKSLPSPYLWSYTQHYTKGKYIADGKYDPNAVSKQPGCAAIMLALKAKGAFA